VLLEKVTKRKASISSFFSEEFSDHDLVKSYVENFNGDDQNVEDVKAFILYLFAR